ncbi:MAG: formate dehydrogenase accessory sulfurtransferase FdhD [Candidatus Bathyarchaeota archaeon]|nr:formate dehydrogenase accessory sulfurtransferase FdhD [Candidatus Bathyarchaeota archaeon]MDH5732439.1 formate dehydrogenase accessory sulfurtransferase FdhD [Candidatus Bathyarchaeota archaeon]
MQEVLVSRIDLHTKTLEHKKDLVAEEAPFHVFLNQTHYVTILCTPSQLKELAVGYLLSEGLLKSIDEIREVRLETGDKCVVRLKPYLDVERQIAMAQPFARVIISACGSADYWPISKLMDRLNLPETARGFKMEANLLLASVRQLNKFAEGFRKTGGVHVAALYSREGRPIAIAEDVGRHNAVDKVIGECALKSVNFTECFVALSGRLTGDIVLKAARMQIPIVVSVAAAINSGIEVAKRTGITLVGFARGKRMNAYTHIERITF